MLYEELKKIEKLIEGNEYSCHGVSYFVAIDMIDISLPLNLSIKNYLLELEAIDSLDTNIEIIQIKNPKYELKQLCENWHLDETICNKILSLIDEDTNLYRFCNDSEFVSKGNIGEVFRIIENGEERVAIDFYFVD